ncbi:MAG: SDR family oxidoreductase [Planctomycetes bacterium]|nr:SDR family oxidoreductase [Planctomycetota bacterium]
MTDQPRRALVTGGSTGIGRCIAETLARDGYDVGIFYQGGPDDAAPVAARIESHGRRAWSRVGDVRNVDQVNDAVEALAGQWGGGGIDVLVNNAGIVRDRVIWKMSDEEWRDVLDVDLTGVFNVCRAVVPIMRKQNAGAIVNISSINGLRGKFGQTNYSAAKAGVIGLTKALAKEVARFNVTVNAVAPGLIDTGILDSLSREAKEASIAEILMGRVGTVEDVAETVAFLCSDRARFITGEVIRVDGGQYV